MIELKEIEIDGKKYIEIQDRVYSIRVNPIGVREKFWMVRRGGSSIVESPIVTDILFKYNRNDVSCEDEGEVIACRVMRAVGLKAVEYYLAKNKTLDNNEIKGVLCGSFKKKLSEIETSAYTLQTSYTQFSFDEKTGVANKSINTVDGIIEDLEYVLDESEFARLFVTQIRDELLKQCLMDFLLAQTDRHWLNTSFLEYFVDGKYAVKKAKCYDNGCIAYLKRKRKAIVTITNQVKGDYINSPRMKELLEDTKKLEILKS